jgi:hypothetical protein
MERFVLRYFPEEITEGFNDYSIVIDELPKIYRETTYKLVKNKTDIRNIYILLITALKNEGLLGHMKTEYLDTVWDDEVDGPFPESEDEQDEQGEQDEHEQDEHEQDEHEQDEDEDEDDY